MQRRWTLGIALALLLVPAAPGATAGHLEACGDEARSISSPIGDTSLRLFSPTEGDCTGATVDAEPLDCTDKPDLAAGPLQAHALDGSGCDTGAATDCTPLVDCGPTPT